MLLVRPIQTRFRYGFTCNGLTLQHTLTRWLMQKVRDQAFLLRDIALSLLVNTRFQILFHSPARGSFHLSLAVLCSLSVSQQYLALADGSAGFRQDLTCPALLRIPLRSTCLSCTGLSPPSRVTGTSSWPWLDHSGFGSTPSD